MAWFDGNVDEAVKICRQRAGLLTIFIRDSSEESQKLEGIFAEADVASLVRDKHSDILLLKIIQGTANFDLLHSVYPVTSIPMIQFIDGANGMLLYSVVPSGKDDIVKGLTEGIDTWLHQRAALPTTNLSEASVPRPSSSSTTTTTVVRNDDSTTTTDQAADSQADLQARVARAQERAIEIRKQKEREAERLQREKEIQRRKDGQLTAEAERARQVYQAEQTRLEIEKERQQEAAHRQRVLDNLRQDKEDRERRIREAKELAAGGTSINQSPPSTGATSSGGNLPASTDYTKARIQFRYEAAEGMRNFIGEFEADDLFGRAVEFVRKETGLKKFTLRQLYPRKDFTDVEGKISMRDLGLVPNGVLLVIPAGGPRPSSSDGSRSLFSQFLSGIWYALSLPLQGINYLIGYVFPQPRIDNATTRPTNYSAARTSSPSDRAGSNVHRRRPPSDDPTYNGNSTQQL
ncbi:hypothetical protein BV898_05829 [Hypsibius exemplaris]|uniref:UBX domain-containing protein 4 n=1 Tax=Hypsibius exemplaris TaxID=2072580 RepID=A0A1W0WYJ9_HYPEX|nr:hypothetical protein BV898_05829 [Hypsibius exemplaris]